MLYEVITTLGAQVGGHAGQDHPVDAPLAQLQNEVIRFGPVNFVCTADDRLAVVDVGFVPLQPIGAGTFEALHAQGVIAIEHADLVHQFFKSPFEAPTVIRITSYNVCYTKLLRFCCGVR